MTIEQMETPVVVVDLDILEANLQATAQLTKQAGVKLRPHTKTHKSVWIAKRQIELGAVGITVAKLGEAEVMVAGGITDILIAYPIVGKAKLERLRKLMEVAKITVSTDNYQVAQGLSELGEAIGRKVPLYIDVNTGLGRCGKEPGEETVELVKQIATLQGIEITGIMTHSGHAYGKKTVEEIREVAIKEAQDMVRTKQMLAQAGIHIAEVSVGSTPTSKFVGDQHGVTETRPGAYVFGDQSQLVSGLITEEQCAMYVRGTVVSMPRAGTIIVDAGSKTFGTDQNAFQPGYGTLVGNREIYVERLSEEHGNVKVPADAKFEIGDVLSFIPNHCCFTTNLHNRLIGVRNGKFEQEISIDARGKIL